jgi:mannose-6-phosphate isomerase-like protein (cupin superfamily)
VKACRYASVFALGAAIVEACGGDLPKAEAPPTIAPQDASVEAPVFDAQFIRGQTRISAPACSRVYIVVAQGKATTAKEQLDSGDLMIVKYPDPMYVNVDGLALRVIESFPCQLRDKPGPEVALRRAGQAPELTWGKGTMHAHLDVGSSKDDEAVSPRLYVGRLSGTGAVAEHRHQDSVEIIAAVEASGTFTIAGSPHRLGAGEIVTVPKDTLHSWTPDPGSNLVAIQMYLPHGPELRFVALDAAEKDAGLDGSTKR